MSAFARSGITLEQDRWSVDQPLVDVMICDDFQQLIELANAQALAEVGFEQAAALADGIRFGVMRLGRRNQP